MVLARAAVWPEKFETSTSAERTAAGHSRKFGDHDDWSCLGAISNPSDEGLASTCLSKGNARLSQRHGAAEKSLSLDVVPIGLFSCSCISVSPCLREIFCPETYGHPAIACPVEIGDRTASRAIEPAFVVA